VRHKSITGGVSIVYWTAPDFDIDSLVGRAYHNPNSPESASSHLDH
jgi:hypothetical protein